MKIPEDQIRSLTCLRDNLFKFVYTDHRTKYPYLLRSSLRDFLRNLTSTLIEVNKKNLWCRYKETMKRLRQSTWDELLEEEQLHVISDIIRNSFSHSISTQENVSLNNSSYQSLLKDWVTFKIPVTLSEIILKINSKYILEESANITELLFFSCYLLEVLKAHNKRVEN